MTKQWTEDEIRKLKRLRELGASPARAGVALKCGKVAVRAKARELGIPFPHFHAQKRERLARETAARAKAGLPLKR